MNIPLNIDWQQILLHLFNFAILACGLYILLYKPVKEFMDKRMEHYQKIENAAVKKFEEAAFQKKELNKRLADIDEEISKKREEQLEQMEVKKAQELEATRLQCEKILENARKNADLERDKIISEAKQDIAQIAIEAFEKLMSSEDTLEGFLNTREELSDGR